LQASFSPAELPVAALATLAFQPLESHAVQMKTAAAPASHANRVLPLSMIPPDSRSRRAPFGTLIALPTGGKAAALRLREPSWQPVEQARKLASPWTVWGLSSSEPREPPMKRLSPARLRVALALASEPRVA